MLILSSVFPISVNAGTDTTLKNTDIINDDALSGDYDNYISQYKDVKSSSIDIIIENVDVSFANNEIVDFSIVASNEALYALKFEYATTENGREPLAISLKIDGSYLYKDLEYINLPRYYQDIGNKRTDNKGNETAKEIGQKIGNYEIVVRNENNTDYLLIYLNEGIHTLQLENLSDEFELLKIGLIEVPKTTYGEMYMDEETTAVYTYNSIINTWAHGCNAYLWWLGFDQGELRYIPYGYNNRASNYGLFKSDYKQKRFR